MIQNVEQAETGAAIGYLSLARSMGSTLGPTLAGILITMDTLSGYTYMNIIIAAISLLSVGLILKKEF